MGVVDAVERYLSALPGGLGESPLGASALVMAEQLDDPENSATSKSMCARELRDTMDRLSALAPPVEQEDEVDRKRRERAERLARQSTAGASPSP